MQGHIERRPAELQDLSAKECVLLSKRAELLCVERLSALAANLAPHNEKLSRAVASMATDEQSHLERVAVLDAEVPWPALLCLDEPGLRLLLATHLPTLQAGCTARDREGVFNFVRTLEEESARLYRSLALHCADMQLKVFFAQVAIDEEQHAEHFLTTA
jgi:rubrerythrin